MTQQAQFGVAEAKQRPHAITAAEGEFAAEDLEKVDGLLHALNVEHGLESHFLGGCRLRDASMIATYSEPNIY